MNIHEVPKINKIVINMGLGEAKDDSKVVDKAHDLTLIAGQRAIKTTAKKLFKNVLACLRCYGYIKK